MAILRGFPRRHYWIVRFFKEIEMSVSDVKEILVIFFQLLAGLGVILLVLIGISATFGILAVRRVPLKKLLLLTYGDDLVCGVMNFPGRHFDHNGKVVDGSGAHVHSYGNCPWIIIWRRWVFYLGLFVKPVSYDENNNPDGFGKGIYADLSDKLVKVKVVDAETKDIPDPAFPNDPTKALAGPTASFDAQTIGHIEDPRLFVVESPLEVFQADVVDEFEACLRTDARLKTEQEVLGSMVGGQVGQSIQRPEVGGAVVLGIMRTRWGFVLLPENITIKNITFKKPYQDARQAARLAQMEAQATTARVYDPVKSAIAAGIDAKDAVRLRELDMDGTVIDVNIHSNNQSISPDTVVIGGGGVGVLAGGKKGGKGSGGGQQKDSLNTANPPPDNPADTAERYFKRHGKYPSWDPLKRTPSE